MDQSLDSAWIRSRTLTVDCKDLNGSDLGHQWPREKNPEGRGGPKLYGEKINASHTDFATASSMAFIHDVFEGRLKGVEDLTWQPIHTFHLCITEPLEEFAEYIIW